MSEMRIMRAINTALVDAMSADPTVVVFGEDVAYAGGVFGVTKGLLDAFGEERVRDTPISESAIVGAAAGAAISGLKPVVEIMFMDFIGFAMDSLCNQAAKLRFMFGGQCSVPMVVRTCHGGGLNAGPQHSQCLEAWLAHVPGLKVVCPANSADAYGLLRAAIDDPDPVVYIEHKAMYSSKGEVPDPGQVVPIGRASTARKGRDATIISYGSTVAMALAAAELFDEMGEAAVEVIDLRSIQPWDEEAVLESLGRTHRLVIAHEAVEAFGVGAEIAARIAEIGFDELDAPIVRVGAPFMPVPFARSLESAYRPCTERIVSAVRRVLE